jgi:hypothetical protein
MGHLKLIATATLSILNFTELELQPPIALHKKLAKGNS